KDCLEKLEGMYAFAIHDAQTGETFMASDPTGQKSIYMYENNDAIVFASEMNALVSNPHRQKSWDQEGLAEIVAHRFIVGDNTHVKEIRKLTPGTFATMSKERGFEQKPFYQVPIGDQSRDDVAAIQADIRKAVIDGNRRTFNLEVPYGMLLSGGIDSTLVLGQAHARGLPMKTYSVGFRPTDERISGAQTMFNEFPHSRAVAERYGTDHTEIELTDVDYCEYLDRWCEMSGEVLGSQEAPCLIKLFETVGQDARVIFSGSGPDELFDGYSYGKRMEGTPLGALPEKYFDSFHWSGDVDLQRLMPGMDAKGITAAKYRRFLEPYGDQVQDALQATQLIHFHGRLGAYEFRQMDTISMA
ncbi:MAG: asparagine synthase-related protein, partial [Pseudomonadota bacterium]